MQRVKRQVHLNQLVVLLGVTLAVLALGGCGKKGPPVAPSHVPMRAVSDLQGSIDGTTVTLEWTHRRARASTEHYIILRAQARLPQIEPCTGCPLVFQRVGTVPVRMQTAAEAERFVFSQTVPRGFRFTYSVRPAQSSGAQGPDSNLIEIRLP